MDAPFDFVFLAFFSLSPAAFWPHDYRAPDSAQTGRYSTGSCAGVEISISNLLDVITSHIVVLSEIITIYSNGNLV